MVTICAEFNFAKPVETPENPLLPASSQISSSSVYSGSLYICLPFALPKKSITDKTPVIPSCGAPFLSYIQPSPPISINAASGLSLHDSGSRPENLNHAH